jgi:hypothetical protein
LDFYQKLGFEIVGGDKARGWVMLEHGNLILGLFHGHLPGNVLNFRGGDIHALAEELKRRGIQLTDDARVEADGSAGAWLSDPDDNLIYLNSYLDEKP